MRGLRRTVSINVIAVLSGHVVELGIGTFLTPLISVSCGVLFFHERLSRTKTAGVMLAMTGVLIMIVSFGHFPWISLGVSATGRSRKSSCSTPG